MDDLRTPQAAAVPRVSDERVQVLIAGGGVVGLSMALFLRRHGVDVLLVERHPDVSPLPRGRIVHPRTMELYRAAGVEPAIRAAPPSVFRGFPESLRARTLAAPEVFRATRPPLGGSSGVSPCAPALIDQSALEPIVREHAARTAARIEFGTRLADFTADAEGVDVRLAGPAGARTVRADYLVAADGHRSGVRRRLGICTSGRGTPMPVATIAFEADLEPALRGRRLALCYLETPEPGTLLTLLDRPGRWQLTVPLHPERGESADTFTEPHCLRLVRAATALPGLRMRLLRPFGAKSAAVHTWELADRVADRYRQGRVLLVGDACHVMPPAGGLGANTGIQDAHNLAWKLAAVLQGHAGAALLDTYESERRPVALLTCDSSLRRQEQRISSDGDQGRVDPLTLGHGYRYRSAAVVPDRDRDQEPGAVAHPTGGPGTRAPHLPVLHRGRTVSLLDLFGAGFTLLAGADGAAWTAAAGKAAAQLGVPLRCLRDGRDFVPAVEQWTRRYGITAAGAVLIRPDGVVAWRGTTAAECPAAVLDQVLTTLLAR